MKLLYKFFLSVFAFSTISLVAGRAPVHRDVYLPENSGRAASGATERNYDEPTQAYLWRSTHLSNADRAVLKNYNPVVEYSSRGSAYLGVPKLGIIPEFRSPTVESHQDLNMFNVGISQHEEPLNSIYERNEDLFAEPEQLPSQQEARQNYLEKKHEDLNVVARNISRAGQSLGLRSRGLLLPHEDVIARNAALEAINTIFYGPLVEPLALEQAGIEYGNGPFRDDLQAYKDYYGPAFGSAFLKMAESVPQAFKSMDGFHDAMNYFFEVFKFRADYLRRTGEDLYADNNTWANYLSDGFQRFVAIFVKRFNEQGIVNHQDIFDTNELDNNEVQYDDDIESLRL